MSDDDELRLLREVLENPPFTARDSQPEAWLVILLHWLSALLRQLSSPLLLIIIAGVALIALFVLLSRNWRSNVTTSPATTEQDDDSMPATSANALSNAQRYAGDGDYRQAIRQLYLATLLLLDEGGALRFDRSLTNRETLRALNKSPQLALALTPIVEVYDRVWYGFGAVTSEQFEQYRSAIESVRRVGEQRYEA